MLDKIYPPARTGYPAVHAARSPTTENEWRTSLRAIFWLLANRLSDIEADFPYITYDFSTVANPYIIPYLHKSIVPLIISGDTSSTTTTEVSLVPARRSRAGASDSDRGVDDGVSIDINSVYLYPSRTTRCLSIQHGHEPTT